MSEFMRLQRALQRTGTRRIICALILLSMALAWVLRTLGNWIHACVRLLKLERAEEWLRTHSLWYGLIPLGIVWAGLEVIKVFDLYLFYHGHWVYGILLAIVLKVVGLAFISYLGRLYGERLLQYAWIARRYEQYKRLRAFFAAWLAKQAWYQNLHEIKAQIVAQKKIVLEWIRRKRSIIAKFKRLWRRKQRKWV